MRERARERAAPVDGHRARKRFGQHFLVDTGVVRGIVDAIAPQDGQHIVEIGPGLGALTGVLLERVDAIQAVELDRDLARRLRGRYPAARLALHEADALVFDFGLALPADARAAGQRLRIVGNLPYNISSPLLLHLLEQRAIVDDLHFMLQKEVVDRIVAGPGSADYGRLSVLMQSFCHCVRLFDVPASAFDPPPRVESAVVRMALRRERDAADPAPLQTVLAVAFGQRRKMLRGTLLPWLAQRGVDAPEIEPTARAEEIGIDVWWTLADRVAARGPAGPVV
ncbi:MAG TPA: 16S rRNA (adenine(1518)-N(6)/adenine(1519)-N(6))-dimethyltransferase RsmA [Burkholderiaceae bacterium]|nr:16S rRNA (adenine(1518)-N(6)/adenine(1519)-N(6))-dimethyltransferase RsmA [Burkholderiaceae bacterium]